MTASGSSGPAGRLGVHHVRVRYAETDQMGVAHHGSYVLWIEEARTEWMREQGRSYREVEAEGLALAVTAVSIRYHRSARYDDLVRIETRLSEVGKASVTLAYELFMTADGTPGGRGPLLARAETRLALLGRHGRPIRLPAGFFDPGP